MSMKYLILVVAEVGAGLFLNDNIKWTFFKLVKQIFFIYMF